MIDWLIDWFIYLSIYLFIYLFIYLSVRLFIYYLWYGETRPCVHVAMVLDMLLDFHGLKKNFISYLTWASMHHIYLSIFLWKGDGCFNLKFY